jgi:hypothetical protein
MGCKNSGGGRREVAMGFSAKVFGEKRNLKRSLIFLALCVIFTGVALVMGINDNIPGFIVLVVGAFSLALAIVHGWRKSKRYLILAISSFVGFFVFAVLVNLMEFLTRIYADMFVYYIFAGINVVSYFMVLLICPLGFLTGFFGFVIFKSKEYRERKIQTKLEN